MRRREFITLLGCAAVGRCSIIVSARSAEWSGALAPAMRGRGCGVIAKASVTPHFERKCRKIMSRHLILAILFVLLGAVEHPRAQDVLAEAARKQRAIARCKMESMKYNLMDSDELKKRLFYVTCMEAEGYAFDPKPRFPSLKNQSCGALYEKEHFPPDLAACWK